MHEALLAEIYQVQSAIGQMTGYPEVEPGDHPVVSAAHRTGWRHMGLSSIGARKQAMRCIDSIPIPRNFKSEGNKYDVDALDALETSCEKDHCKPNRLRLK